MSRYNWMDDELERRAPRKQNMHPPVENYIPREARPDITDRVLEAPGGADADDRPVRP